MSRGDYVKDSKGRFTGSRKGARNVPTAARAVQFSSADNAPDTTSYRLNVPPVGQPRQMVSTALAETQPVEDGLVAPVACSRCGGQGFVNHPVKYRGIAGLCFKCAGAGVQESDPATLRAQRVARANSRRQAQAQLVLHSKAVEIVREWDGHRPTRRARQGLDTLQILEPERYQAALLNIQVRPEQVCEALHKYFHTHSGYLRMNGGEDRIVPAPQ